MFEYPILSIQNPLPNNNAHFLYLSIQQREQGKRINSYYKGKKKNYNVLRILKHTARACLPTPSSNKLVPSRRKKNLQK